MYIGLHVKCLLFSSDFNKSQIFSADFSKKSSDIKFYENPLSVSRVVPCGRMDGHEANFRFSQFCEKSLINKYYSYIYD
jgi:hypothetical protein